MRRQHRVTSRRRCHPPFRDRRATASHLNRVGANLYLVPRSSHACTGLPHLCGTAHQAESMLVLHPADRTWQFSIIQIAEASMFGLSCNSDGGFSAFRSVAGKRGSPPTPIWPASANHPHLILRFVTNNSDQRRPPEGPHSRVCCQPAAETASSCRLARD